MTVVVSHGPLNWKYITAFAHYLTPSAFAKPDFLSTKQLPLLELSSQSALAIDANGDFVVKVNVVGVVHTDQGRKNHVIDNAAFRVSEKVLMDNSEYFKVARLPGSFQEGCGSEIELENGSTRETWLWAIHGIMPSTDGGLTEW